MVNIIQKTSIFLSKNIIIFIIMSLLNFSFMTYDWDEDLKNRKKIQENIQNIFNSSTYKIDSMSDNFYKILESDTIVGYFIAEQAFSKYKTFDYLIIYNNFAEILKVEILNYREKYGFEICNKKWLQQFIGNNSDSEFEFNSKVDAISGSTISVNSCKNAAFIKTQTLRKIINE